MRAVIYTRVSTDEQGENFSLPSQAAVCRAYANHHEMQIVAEFSDTMSGAHLERPGLRRVRDLIQAQAVEAVIVYTLDRLSRNVAHLLVLRDEMSAAGVQLHIVTRGQKSDTTPEGRLFDTIEGAFAEFERLKIRERAQRGKRQKLLSGRILAQGIVPPYGYRYEGRGRDRALVVHPEEAEIVNLIYQWAADGDPARGIAARLTDLGVSPPGNQRHVTARRWYHQTVSGIIRNPTYRGVHISPSHNIEVSVPRIVDAALWYAANTALDGNRQRARRNATRVYPLRGRIRCACGAPMHGERVGRGHTYYRCAAHDNEGRYTCCLRQSIRTETVEHAVWAWVVQHVLDEERLAAAIDAAMAAEEEQTAALERERAVYERQIADAAARTQRLIDLYTAGAITIEDVTTYKRQYDAQRDAAVAEIERLNRNASAAAEKRQSRDDVLALARNVRDLFLDPSAITPGLQMQVYDALDLRVVRDGDELHVSVSLTGDAGRVRVAERQSELSYPRSTPHTPLAAVDAMD